MPSLVAPSLAAAKQQRMQQQAWSDVGRIGLLMAGLGAGWRGLEGLTAVTHRNLVKRKPTLGHPEYVDIDPEEKHAAESPIDKGLSALTSPFRQAMGGQVSAPQYLPWYLPLALMTGAGSAYGGYKLTDKLLDRRRNVELKSELDEAKDNYRTALRGGSKLATVLDQLCNQLEKTAFMSPDTAGMGLGAVLTAMGLLGAGSGLIAYDMTRKSSPDKVLDEAKRRQARARLRTAPSPIYARLPSHLSTEPEDSPVDKLASDWSEKLRRLQTRREIPGERAKACPAFCN